MMNEEAREALAVEMDRHVVEEDRILKEYHALSDRLADGPLSVLVNHIVTEEEMHHFLLRTLSDWLRTPPPDSESLEEQGVDAAAVLRDAEKLREHEKQTIEACRDLKSRHGREAGKFFEGIVDAIILDSEKHHRLLVLVESMLGDSR